MKVGLVIMASGLGKRFGGNKLMAELQDRPLIRWILDTTEGLFDERIVVTRSSEVRALCEKLKIRCIHHELPFRSDTVRLGMSALEGAVDYCFFVPGDQPLLRRESLLRLIEAARQQPDRILRAGYEETVGAPTGFPKGLFEGLKALPEGKGGNWIAKQHPERIRIIPVADAFELVDVDTMEDLARIKERLEEREGQSC